MAWQAHAMLVLKSKAGPNQIEIANSLARGIQHAKPEEYQDLRGFYQKVDAAEQAQLVLTIAPAAPAWLRRRQERATDAHAKNKVEDQELIASLRMFEGPTYAASYLLA